MAVIIFDWVNPGCCYIMICQWHLACAIVIKNSGFTDVCRTLHGKPGYFVWEIQTRKQEIKHRPPVRCIFKNIGRFYSKVHKYIDSFVLALYFT